MAACFYSLNSSSCHRSCVAQTFLRSTALRGENDENRQDENPGPCRSPAHHYRSAHSSLQSECIMLASGPAAPLQPVARKSEEAPSRLSRASHFPPRMSSFFSVSFHDPVVCDTLTMEVTAPHTHTCIHTHPICGATSSTEAPPPPPPPLPDLDLGYPSPPSGLNDPCPFGI